MNYLKHHKEAYNLTFRDIESETGLNKSKLCNLARSKDNAEFLRRCSVADYKKMKQLFTELETVMGGFPLPF
jgi:hypothetical protein